MWYHIPNKYCLKLLWESIDRTPVIYELEDDLPSDNALYDGEVPE